MELFDTHCHIHEAQSQLSGDEPVRQRWLKAGKGDADVIIADAQAAGVVGMICVGTDVADSVVAVDFVQSRPAVWASIGIHPHEAKRYVDDNIALDEFSALLSSSADKPKTQSKVVAIGECGLDYFYEHSPKADQEKILRYQIDLALEHDLPMIFHVREAFGDFWRIFDSYSGIRGVVHSFSAGRKELDEVLARGLYVGLNGIMTFTKDSEQLAAAKAVPVERMLLETDAPFLTPSPYRGKMCEPKHVRVTMEFLAALREDGVSTTDEPADDRNIMADSQERLAANLAFATTINARHLFNLHG